MSRKISQALTTTLAKIGKDWQKPSQSKPKRKSWRGLQMARRSSTSRVPRGIMAGYGSAITASFYTSRRGDGEIVRGFDLVTSPYSPSTLSAPNISYFITANPASWNGTRVSAIASGYQNYRPLSFKIHYRPQVGSTSEISMFIGTVWQNTYITSRSTIEPSLVTSPGGTYLPAWQSSCSVVPLGGRLPQRMFPIRDPEFTTVPFSVVCRASDGGPDSDSVEMPGRIFIEYTYEFRNAIGSGGGGFQPSTTTSKTIEVSTLYTGTTSIGNRVIVTGGSSEAASTVPVGWIIDEDSGTQGTSSISTTYPLFAKFDTDEIVASRASGGAPSAIPVLQINGSSPDPSSTPRPVSLRLYSDDGRPS